MATPPTVADATRSTPVVDRSDVLVVGGGPAGVSAAVAAARSGARVTLVERYPYLGGLASGGMVLVLDDMVNGAEITTTGLVGEANPTLDNAVRARAMPYTGWAGFAYDAALPRAALREVLREAARREIRVASMGTDLLDLYEDVNRVVPIRDRRWVVEHVSTLTADEIARIRDLGVVVTTHTNRYLFKEGEILRSRVGAEDSIVPLRSLQDAGVHVALATDNVPTSLFHPIWHAVARLDRSSRRIIAPGQRLGREEALRAATLEGAYLTFEESEKGSLEPGKLADLAVLSDNPFTCPEDRIKDITAELTIVAGQIVHGPRNGRP